MVLLCVRFAALVLFCAVCRVCGISEAVFCCFLLFLTDTRAFTNFGACQCSPGRVASCRFVPFRVEPWFLAPAVTSPHTSLTSPPAPLAVSMVVHTYSLLYLCVSVAVLRLLGRQDLHGLGLEDHGETPHLHGCSQRRVPGAPARAREVRAT